MIYFDNAATTNKKPKEVIEGINYALSNYNFNAGRGSYKEAKKTFKMIEETREKIASLINTSKEKVVFTSSATESLNNIIYGLDLKKEDEVFISPFEHNAVVRTLYKVGVNINYIPFNKEDWSLEKNKFSDLLTLKKPKAIIISHISNVTGFELPYNEIFGLGKGFNTINVLDCAQSFGVYDINKESVDILVFAGHKSLYSLFGIAGYINISNIKLQTYKVGGTGTDSLNLEMPLELPSRYEAGSLNAIGIYSINCAIDFLKKSNFSEIKRELVLYLLKELKKIKGLIIYAPKDYIPRGIVSFNLEGYKADEVGTILSEEFDICVRTGYHCAPIVHDFIDSKKYLGTVRISFSGFNTKEEIDCLINALREM